MQNFEDHLINSLLESSIGIQTLLKFDWEFFVISCNSIHLQRIPIHLKPLQAWMQRSLRHSFEQRNNLLIILDQVGKKFL